MVAGRKMCWEQIYFKGSSSNNCSKQPTSLLYKFFSTVFGIVEMIKIFFQTPITLAKSDTVLFVEILDLGISEDELANHRIKEAWIRPARRKSHQSQSVRHTSSNSYLEGKSSCTWYSLLFFWLFLSQCVHHILRTFFLPSVKCKARKLGVCLLSPIVDCSWFVCRPSVIPIFPVWTLERGLMSVAQTSVRPSRPAGGTWLSRQKKPKTQTSGVRIPNKPRSHLWLVPTLVCQAVRAKHAELRAQARCFPELHHPS